MIAIFQTSLVNRTGSDNTRFDILFQLEYLKINYVYWIALKI